MTSTNSDGSHPRNIPGYVKIIILAQSAIILLFSIGMYQEYVSNLYLQTYLVQILTSNIMADAMLSIVTMSVFALGTFTLLGSMDTSRRANKELRLLSESSNEEMAMPSMPVLQAIEAAPRPQRARTRTRKRKPAIDADELYRSMTSFADARKQQ